MVSYATWQTCMQSVYLREHMQHRHHPANLTHICTGIPSRRRGETRFPLEGIKIRSWVQKPRIICWRGPPASCYVQFNSIPEERGPPVSTPHRTLPSNLPHVASTPDAGCVATEQLWLWLLTTNLRGARFGIILRVGSAISSGITASLNTCERHCNSELSSSSGFAQR